MCGRPWAALTALGRAESPSGVRGRLGIALVQFLFRLGIRGSPLGIVLGCPGAVLGHFGVVLGYSGKHFRASNFSLVSSLVFLLSAVGVLGGTESSPRTARSDKISDDSAARLGGAEQGAADTWPKSLKSSSS